MNASERIAIGDPVSRRFTLTATGHLNDSEVIQELTTCVVLYVRNICESIVNSTYAKSQNLRTKKNFAYVRTL